MELTPKNDVIFKMIFADPKHTRVLVHFLNSVIKQEPPIRSIEIQKTELIPEYADKKGIRLDIVATTNTGEIVNIEMQKKNEGDMAARSLFYWSKLFSAQLIVGGEFSELKRTISINILDFTMFQAAYDYGNGISIAKNEGRDEGLAEGEAIGLEKGKLEKARETAASFLAMGLSVKQVVQGTGLSLEEVLRLKNDRNFSP
ncbi:MAG: Rpn family recombination-promoting nuclease/putative transposase [Holosporales bacterium]|jgi:hypothetical protein|nr:Rpn family recombination-promoting nuclease/putative transposase [Holosporales bacterium]